VMVTVADAFAVASPPPRTLVPAGSAAPLSDKERDTGLGMKSCGAAPVEPFAEVVMVILFC
jgi:hypothetical protein